MAGLLTTRFGYNDENTGAIVPGTEYLDLSKSNHRGALRAAGVGTGVTASQLTLPAFIEGVLTNEWAKPENFQSDRLAPKFSDKRQHGKWMFADDTAAIWVDTTAADSSVGAELRNDLIAGNEFVTKPHKVSGFITESDLEAAQTELGIDVVQYEIAAKVRQLKLDEAMKVYSAFRSINPTTRAYDAGLGLYQDYSAQVISASGAQWTDPDVDPLKTILVAYDRLLSIGSPIEPNVLVLNSLALKVLRDNPFWASQYRVDEDRQPILIVPGSKARGLEIIELPERYKATSEGSAQLCWGADVWIGYLEGYNKGYAGPFLEAVNGPMEPSAMVFPDPDRRKKQDIIAVDGPKYDVFCTRTTGNRSGVLVQDIYGAISL